MSAEASLPVNAILVAKKAWDLKITLKRKMAITTPTGEPARQVIFTYTLDDSRGRKLNGADRWQAGGRKRASSCNYAAIKSAFSRPSRSLVGFKQAPGSELSGAAAVFRY